jgi:hypothetical protein
MALILIRMLISNIYINVFGCREFLVLKQAVFIVRKTRVISWPLQFHQNYQS